MKRDITERLERIFIGSRFIQAFAKGLQQPMDKFFLQGPGRPLKLFLNGAWLEHPVHPLVTDVVVGAWTLAILFDLLALLLRLPGLGVASAIAVGLGVLAAIASIITGLMDWMDIDPDELAVGVTHGLINIVATLFFAASLVFRWRHGWDIDARAFIPALVGYLLITLGAYIGGSLVFRMGVMVNRNAYRRSKPKSFVPVIALTDVLENKPIRVDAKGEPVLLVRRGERIYAIGAVCSHYGAPLEDGKLEDECIACPWHDSKFALADGSVKRGPTTAPVPHYVTRVSNGNVEVRLDQ
jgi:nitrite reductase/ring-hydroxylating ferredoxin subunit/uncharacterized membrane protein